MHVRGESCHCLLAPAGHRRGSGALACTIKFLHYRPHKRVVLRTRTQHPTTQMHVNFLYPDRFLPLPFARHACCVDVLRV